MNDNQGFMDDENLIERKKRLEEELDKKVSNDYREFIEKSNEYLQKTKENTKRYYQDLLSKELDSMENALKSGNTLQAMSHRLTANVYESIIQNYKF
jgi:6-pyruvoyl-tetrahydropterin synthase